MFHPITVHPITGRRREPSSPCPTLEKSTKTANDALLNHQQQSSLQDEANKTNSRDMDTDFSGSNNKRPLYNHRTCSQSPDNTRHITRMRTSRNQFKQENTHPEHAQLSQQTLMKGPPSRTQTVTQTHDLSLWSAEPMRGSEKQLLKKSMKPRPKKHTPTSQNELARLDSSDLASSLWNYKKNIAAQFNNPTEMLNAIYYYHLQARRVLDSKICLNQRKRKLDQNEVAENQKQYLVQYEPLVVERWALTTIKKVKEIQIKSITNLPRCCFEDASCEICCDPRTKEEQLDPTTDMYQCNTCHRTYHWQCLLDLECYTDAQRDGIIAHDDWACPA